MFRALRSADLAVLVVLFVGAHTAALDICGGRNPMGMFALIVGWTWPALRGMMHWRTQNDPQRAMPGIAGMPIQGWSNTIALAVLGGAWWWCVLPLAIQFHSTALLPPLAFPNALRWFGVLMTLAGLLRPIWSTGRHANDGVLDGMTLDFGLFFASASPLIGGLAAAGLAVRLVSARAATRRSPHACYGVSSEICLLRGAVQDQKEVHPSEDLLVAKARALQHRDRTNSFADRYLVALAFKTPTRGSAIAQR